MQFHINNRPDYASLHAVLNQGEQLVTEAGAMMSMDPGLDLKTTLSGGLLGAAKRKLGGESLFMNTYTATADGQHIDVAPGCPGDLEHIAIDEHAIIVQSGSYCACTPGVEVNTKWGGAKTFFGGEGLFMLRCSGQGDLFVASYGAIHSINVRDGYTVDTSHIVAFDDSLTFSVTRVGGLKSLFLSQEGLVCRFTGTGRLWIQTRSVPALASFLHPFRRVKPKKQ